MADKILKSFDVWIAAQGVKSRTRLRSVDNISLEGIARLRELILEFAIRGKLISQDSTDEPSTILLQKMAQEESELVEKKIIKKPKELPPIQPNEFPFELPKGWAYTRLNNVGEWGAGATPLRGKHDYYGGEIPWFKSGELSSDYISKSEETVTELALKETSLRFNKVGDVLIAMYGATIGKASILEVPATTNQAVCVCTPFSGVYNAFLLLLLKAYNSRFVNMGAGGAQPNISREKIIATIIALPPLAEQHRIVGKVEELMALCDELEKQETHHLKSHALLVETLLGTLTQAKDAKEFQQAWKTLAQHFDDLFTTEDSIDQLKQTILQLAVMGKLVPQDPKDEPASVLLGNVIRQQEKLIANKSLKAGKATDKPVFLLNDIQFPKSWVLCKADQVFFITKLAGFEYTDHFVLSDNSEVPVVRAQNVRPITIDKSNLLYIDLKTSKLLDRCSLTKKSLLITFIGAGIGDVATFNEQERWHLAPNVAKMEPFDGCEDYFEILFFNYFLVSALGQREIFKHLKATAQPSLSMGTIRDIDLPVPPTAEQRGIVSKVNELFALCDDLKARLAAAQTLANQMAEGVVAVS